jgi:thiosulfate/3-mercaptopyruvate sulfurtransferase
MNRFLEPTEIPNDAIVLDARPAPLYAAGHVPGARPIDFVSQKFIIRDAAGLEVFQHTVQQVVRDAGLEAGQQVVLYDNGPETRAARAAWALEYAGFEVALLRGGFGAYQLSGLPIETKTPSWTPSNFVIEARPELLATADEVRDRLQTGDALVLDARNDPEYQGAHIPGAKHFDWVRVMSNAGYLNGEDLREAVQDIPKDQEVIVHCQSGARSAALYHALRDRGYRVKNYVGSMNEWGSQPDLKTEAGAGTEI